MKKYYIYFNLLFPIIYLLIYYVSKFLLNPPIIPLIHHFIIVYFYLPVFLLIMNSVLYIYGIEKTIARCFYLMLLGLVWMTLLEYFTWGLYTGRLLTESKTAQMSAFANIKDVFYPVLLSIILLVIKIYRNVHKNKMVDINKMSSKRKIKNYVNIFLVFLIILLNINILLYDINMSSMIRDISIIIFITFFIIYQDFMNNQKKAFENNE